MTSAPHKAYQFGPFLLDPKERFFLRDGRQIDLTPKAFDILLLLVVHSGHTLTKDVMLRSVWPDTFVEEANLTNNISSLRRALGDDSESQQYIKTVPRVGYRFVAAVTNVPSTAADSSNPLLGAFPRRRTALTLGAVAALLLLTTTGWILWTRSSRTSKAALPFSEREWVLIAGFDNRTTEAIFDGTIESALARELSNSRFVNVISPERAGDALRLMKKPPETRIDAAVGREICLRDGAIRALVTGRIEKLGSSYVMSVSLVDPFRDQTVSSASEEAANQESIWPAIRRLSNWTRETLGETLASIQQGNEALEKVTTPSLRALQLYTQGMALLIQDQRRTAETVLRQAVAEDPEFASAYILLSWTIRNQGRLDGESGPSSQRALDLSARTSDRERYFIEGSYYHQRGQYEKAVLHYELLVKLYPDHFWGRNNLGYVYFELGRYQEGVGQYAQAAKLRPNDPGFSRMAAWNLMQRDMAEALRVVQRARDIITPEMTAAQPVNVAWIQLFVVHDLWVRGEVEPALKELDRLAKLVDSQEGPERRAFAVCIGNGYLSFGKLKAAEELFLKLSKKDEFLLAEVAYAAGDRAKLRKHLQNQLNSKVKVGPIAALLLARGGFTAEAQKVVAERRASPRWQSIFTRAIVNILAGEIALSRGQTTEAISLLQGDLLAARWIYSPAFFMASESLADAFERHGDLQKSVQTLENASREKTIVYEGEGSIGYHWLRVRWRLAQLYRKVGRSDEAQKIEDDLKKMLAYADPDHPLLVQLNQTAAIAKR